jgi:hypothetical protein
VVFPGTMTRMLVMLMGMHRGDDDAHTPGPVGAASVQTQMRNVDFHVDGSIVLHVDYLRGALLPTSGKAPFFDDKGSFRIGIDTAQVRVTTASLADLLNRYVFAYHGSPLGALRLSIEGNRLRTRAKAHGIPVQLLSEVSVTPAGEIRLHTTSIRAVGIPVKGLLHLIGTRLQGLIDLGRARGVRVDGDDLLLSVNELLPPPRIRGHLVSVRLGPTGMTQTFAPESGRAAGPLRSSGPGSGNYMYYRGGVLKFGRLTMTDVDLLIVDTDPKDPFDFFLDKYQQQLVKGYSRTTESNGLIAFMPDFADLHATATGGDHHPRGQ